MKKHFLKYMDGHTPQLQGILWMLLACIWFSIMAVMIRHMSESMPSLQMVFLRNIASIICFLPWLYKTGVKNILPEKWTLYYYRAITGTLGMSMFFYALALLPLTEIISLTFTVPLITTVFAMIFLKERVEYYKWIALLAGFIGVLIILRPGTNMFQFATMLVLATTVVWSLSNIIAKKMTEKDDPKAIVFLMIVIMTPLSLPMALLVWQTPTFEQFLWVLALGWVTNVAHSCLVHSYSKTDLSVVGPFDFSRLVFVSILAYIFFDEVIDIWTVSGTIVIFASSLYVFRKESKRKNITGDDAII